VSEDYFSATVLSVYIASTEKKDDNEEDDFYENLDQIYEGVPKKRRKNNSWGS